MHYATPCPLLTLLPVYVVSQLLAYQHRRSETDSSSGSRCAVMLNKMHWLLYQIMRTKCETIHMCLFIWNLGQIKTWAQSSREFYAGTEISSWSKNGSSVLTKILKDLCVVMQLRKQAQAQTQGIPIRHLCRGIKPPVALAGPLSYLLTVHFLQGDFSSPAACLDLLY